jgi:hypothetical protein
MRSALDDLDLARLDVIHAGPETFPLGRRVRAVAASRVLADLAARARVSMPSAQAARLERAAPVKE